MSKHLDKIIERLGYANSPCLIYGHNNFDDTQLTTHTIKVLKELAPYAVYMVENEPFVLFFDEFHNQDDRKAINKRIWNAQIPVAIFCGTDTVTIYNGCTIDQKTLLLTQIEHLSVDSIDDNSPFSFFEITSQNFWKRYTNQFSSEKLNDVLLSNLVYLTDKLRNTYHLSYATKLVLRLIFIRYLIDRGVDLDYPGFSSNVAASRSALLKLLENKDSIYSLFTHLKKKFNGNLFELGDEINDKAFTPIALLEIKDFLAANINSSCGQLSLFDLYDFNIIPVELISNIYEILLGKEARDKDNAFYTPKYLVDYILDGTIDKHIKEKGTCKLLDPSCGSGVFLVDSYRRMIEKELNGAFFTENDKLLCDTLTDNIYGIDLNEDAIDVAIFSLYLAMLDYKNPKTLHSFRLPNLKGHNLFVCDFFDEENLSSLQKIPFDFIIGNPPWSNKPGLHVEYCKKHGYVQHLQNNDTCRSFVLRSKDFCNSETQCCFILHSTILYMQKNPSKLFRKFLLTQAEIVRIIELSSVRKLVFKNADAPAVILSYRFSGKNELQNLENRFEYISMKRNIFFELFNIVVVEKTDVKHVQQKLLKENDWAWKTLVYGLTGDIDLILFLKKNFPTLREYIKSQTPVLIYGTGVQYNDGEKMDASHLYGQPLLESKNAIDHFSIALSNISTFSKTKIHRTRDATLFQAPYCLMLRGIDMSDYTMKAVYEENSFVFKEAVFAVKGSFEQKSQLLNIVGLLNSKVYAYFNLMLGSSLGVEREQRQVEEILEFPFVYSLEIANKVKLIQDLIKQDFFVVGDDPTAQINQLNLMILKAFNLSDNEFVDYALRIQIPQLTGKNDHDVYRNVEEKDFNEYSKYYYKYLSDVFEGTGKYIQINVYPKIAKHYSAFEVMIVDSKPEEWLQFINNTTLEKSMFAKFSAHRTNEMFYSLKDVIYFEENSFYIIKPNYYKNWHPAIARLDLMDITNQILSRNGGKH